MTTTYAGHVLAYLTSNHRLLVPAAVLAAVITTIVAVSAALHGVPFQGHVFGVSATHLYGAQPATHLYG